MSRLAQESRPRRQHTRRPVRIAAFVHCRGQCRKVTIVNYSRGGFQLEGTVRVAAGERVTVELLSGNRLPVVVAWAIGSHVGVEFVGPISPGHPVLLALDQAARENERLRPAHDRDKP